MLNLTEHHIFLQQQATNKAQALALVAQYMLQLGITNASYEASLIQRETQLNTYLENGIAIPHGTKEANHLIQQTGVVALQFPTGVVWNDDGDIAYVVFGIAAKNNEHLSYLKAITSVLDNPAITTTLAHTTQVSTFIQLMSAAPDLPTTSTALVQLDAPCASLTSAIALGATKLIANNYVSLEFIQSMDLYQQPVYLGQGIWLASHDQGCLANGISVIRPESYLQQQGLPVNCILVLSVYNRNAKHITDILINPQHQAILTVGSATDIINIFTATEPQLATSNLSNDQEVTPPPCPGMTQAQASTTGSNTVTASTSTNTLDKSPIYMVDVVVMNEYGLHARPATKLVELCRQYQANIAVRNVTQGSDTVNAKSIIKLVSINATKGNKLRFTATGIDAAQALETIKHEISLGLGE